MPFRGRRASAGVDRDEPTILSVSGENGELVSTIYPVAIAGTFATEFDAGTWGRAGVEVLAIACQGVPLAQTQLRTRPALSR